MCKKLKAAQESFQVDILVMPPLPKIFAGKVTPKSLNWANRGQTKVYMVAGIRWLIAQQRCGGGQWLLNVKKGSSLEETSMLALPRYNAVSSGPEIPNTKTPLSRQPQILNPTEKSEPNI